MTKRHGIVSNTTLKLIEGALTFDDGLRPRQVGAKIRPTSPAHLRMALRQLVREGRAAREEVAGEAFFRRQAREAAE